MKVDAVPLRTPTKWSFQVWMARSDKAAMVVWGNKLESHVGVTNFCAVGIRDFVIQNLVFWDDALKVHSSECSPAG